MTSNDRIWSRSTLAAIALIAACGGSREAPGVEFDGAPEPVAATAVGTAPMFAAATGVGEAVAWVSAADSGTDARLYISVNGGPPTVLGDSLGPIEVHGESPPKLAFGQDGALNVIYVVPKVVPGRRFPLAAMRFTRSVDGGKSWLPPVTVTDDEEFGSHNFHSLHVAADGSLYAAWLDSREGKSAAYLTRSTDNGQTWEVNRRVATGEACPCCRTAIATTADGALYVAWRMVMPGGIRDVVVSRSDDHGFTWGDPVRVHADDWVFPGCPHAGPSIQADSAGRLHVAWWTGKEGAAGVAYARSDDGGKHFGESIPLGIAEFSQPAHVQLTLGSGGSVVLVTWDDGTREVPRVVLRTSTDGGRGFGPLQEVSADGRAAGFPVIGLAGGRVTVAWSEQSAETAQREAEAMAAMPKDAPMGLHSVGEARVMVRRATLRAGGS